MASRIPLRFIRLHDYPSGQSTRRYAILTPFRSEFPRYSWGTRRRPSWGVSNFFMHTARDIFSHRPFWAKRFGRAPFLPMSRAEMDELGWDSCDIILVTGDAYVDHPSFGMALIGRVLEAQGFPSAAKAAALRQSGWLIIPTRKPCASNTRPINAIPKLG